MLTDMQEIVAQAAPDEITISGFKGGCTITVQVHTPSLYALLAANALPNPLIPTINRLFAKAPESRDVTAPDAQLAAAMQVIARETLISPSLAELEENGVQLTDRQLLEICLYATRGPAALAAFRGRIGQNAGGDEPDVQNAAEQTSAPD